MDIQILLVIAVFLNSLLLSLLVYDLYIDTSKKKYSTKVNDEKKPKFTPPAQNPNKELK